MKQKRIIAFFIFSLCIGIARSQPSKFFVKRGNNISELTCSNIIFAPITDLYRRAEGAGAVWIKKQIDLNNSFDISFYAAFTDALGEDGAAFVLQTDSNSVGGSDDGLGYKGINQSIAVTFDAIQNTNDNDPAFDHVAIQKNGDIDHNSSNNLAGPLSIEPFYVIQINTPYPPGITFRHLINVKWDPTTQNLTVFIDGAVLIGVKYDLIQKIFNGKSLVYWGFTGSNTQIQSYDPRADIDMGSFSISTGDEIIPKFETLPSDDTCFGMPISFIDKSVYGFDSIFKGTSFSKWYWDFGDGTTSTLRFPPPHAYSTSGTYMIRYSIANETGCTLDTLVKKISLGAIPVASFSHAPGCVSTPVAFTDLSSVKDSNNIVVVWKWNFNNEYTSESRNPVVNFATEGIKTILLSVGSNYGCTGDTTITMVIAGKPVIDFNFSENCDGLVDYTGLLLNSIQPSKWVWQFGDNGQSNKQNTNHQFTTNGKYQTLLLAISDNGCVSDSLVKVITIDKLYPFAGNDTSIAAGQPLQLQASGGTTYEWTPSAGLNNGLISNPVAILNTSQTYIMTVRNAAGCQANDTINIKVYKEPDIYVPNAFTPNNDGKNDIFRITAPGIASVQYFRIYNRWGKLIYQSADFNKGWDGTLNGRMLENDTYVWIIKAIDYNGTVIEKKGTVTLIR